MDAQPPAPGEVILRLEADPRDANRVVVTIGPPDAGLLAAHTLGVHIAVVVQEGLQTGQPCPPALIARLQAGDEFQRHYTRALDFLAVRPRSEAEVRRRLREKGVPPEAIEAVVARLERARYLDDAEFARYWIAERARSRPRGARLLQQELRLKGVSPARIAQALADFEEAARAEEEEAALQALSDPAGPPDDEPPAESREVREALGLAQRKLRSYAGLDPPTLRRRLSGFLLRRGYGYHVVARVLKLVQADD